MGNTALGSQTLFDAILKDTVIAANINGSWMCCVNILTCFQTFQTFLRYHSSCAIITGSLLTLSMMYFCVAVCFLCIVRVGCILNLTLMEEKLGEKLTRNISVSVSLLFAIGITVFLLIKGQILSGMLSLIAEEQTSNPTSKSQSW